MFSVYLRYLSYLIRMQKALLYAFLLISKDRCGPVLGKVRFVCIACMHACMRGAWCIAFAFCICVHVHAFRGEAGRYGEIWGGRGEIRGGDTEVRVCVLSVMFFVY